MSESTPRLRETLDRLPAYVAGRPPVGHRRAHAVQAVEQREPLPAAARGARGDRRGRPGRSTATRTRRRPRSSTRWPSGTTSRATTSPWAPARSGCCSRRCRSAPGPGDEVLYAWRSFEAYPIMTTISGATPVQVPLRPDETHDLDAMADAITDRTRLRLRVHAEQPHGHGRAPGRPRPVPRPGARRRPRRRRRGLRRVRARPERRARHRHLPRPPQRRGAAHLLQGLRPRRTARRLRGRAPAGGPGAAPDRRSRSGSRPWRRPRPSRRSARRPALLARVEALVAERTRVEAALAAQGWRLPPSQANFVWLRLGRADRRVRLGVRGGQPRGAPLRRRRRTRHDRRARGQRPRPRGQRALRPSGYESR